MTFLIGQTFGPSTYISLVNSYSPIAFWPLNGDAHCEVDSNQDGSPSNITFDDHTGPFAEIEAPFFDGANATVDIDIYTTTLNTAVQDAAGEISMIVWAKMESVLSTFNYNIFHLYDGGGDFNWLFWDRANTKHVLGGASGDTIMSWNDGGFDTAVEWQMGAVTMNNTQAKSYLNDTLKKTGSVDTWTGTGLATDGCSIGGEVGHNSNRDWRGYICYVALFDYELTADDISTLANYS